MIVLNNFLQISIAPLHSFLKLKRCAIIRYWTIEKDYEYQRLAFFKFLPWDYVAWIKLTFNRWFLDIVTPCRHGIILSTSSIEFFILLLKSCLFYFDILSLDYLRFLISCIVHEFFATGYWQSETAFCLLSVIAYVPT